MKLSFPILLALLLLLAVASFVPAAAAAAAPAADQAAPVPPNSLAHLTATLTTTHVITPVDLTGAVIYGPGDMDLPADLPVTLYVYQPSQEAMDLILTATTTTRADGAYTFEDVAGPQGSAFMTSVTYADVPYHSSFSMGEPLTITVYPATTATDHLLADQLHLILGFSAGGDLQVMAVYILTNVGNQTIVTGTGGEFMVAFPLPDGALNVDFRRGLVETELETGDGYWKIPAVRPGSLYGVSYLFSMPYEGKITLNQPIALPVSSVGVLLPAFGTLKIESAVLVDSGLSDFGGVSYRVYTGEDLRAGSQLAIRISGDPNADLSAAADNGSKSKLGLVIGLAAFGLALIGAGMWLNRHTRQTAPTLEAEMAADDDTGFAEDAVDTPEDAEALMDDIIALDDLYQAGELPEAAYRERRAELKERLKAVVGAEE